MRGAPQRPVPQRLVGAAGQRLHGLAGPAGTGSPLGHHEVLGSGNDVSDQRDKAPGARLETQGGDAPFSALTAVTLVRTKMSGSSR
jgi:hypothetical protein